MRTPPDRGLPSEDAKAVIVVHGDCQPLSLGRFTAEPKRRKPALTIRSLLALPLLALLLGPAIAAGSSEGHGRGGLYIYFDPIIAQYNQSGEEFRITGQCRSACTLFLAIRHVCIEPSAELRFHAGHDRNGAVGVRETQHMLNAYNGRLRSYLLAQHAMDSFDFFTISGRDMIHKFGYRQCPGT
jgi:hypothetical protein